MLYLGLACLLAAVPTDVSPWPAACEAARYYAVVFSFQEDKAFTRAAHTFATVLRVPAAGHGEAIEAHTISWLPADGIVHQLRFRVIPGRNYGLLETVNIARRDGLRVSMWGPYEIRQPLYCAFVRRKQALDAGRFRYRSIDTFVRETDVVNCIHAITDVDPRFRRERYPLFRYADRASAFIADQMRSSGAIVDGGRAHEELLPVLGLEGYPLVRRSLPPPSAYPLADLRQTLRRE